MEGPHPWFALSPQANALHKLKIEDIGHLHRNTRKSIVSKKPLDAGEEIVVVHVAALQVARAALCSTAAEGAGGGQKWKIRGEMFSLQ